MYKKLLFVMMIAGCAMMAEAKTESSKPQGVHPWKETPNMADKKTGWSLLFEGGFNVFDGDFTANEYKNIIGYPTAGMALEYNFNPNWALGLEYMFAIPQVTGKPSHPELLMKDYIHRGQAYVSFDLFNAFCPKAVSKYVSFSLMFGGGVAFYKKLWWYADKTHENRPYDDPIPDKSYSSCAEFFGGLNFDFNLGRNTSLGLKATYSFFTNDKVDGRTMSMASKNNDGMMDVTAALRWKIAANHKNHYRNYVSDGVLEDKYYASHPSRKKKNAVDTVVVMHKDTVMVKQELNQTVEPAEAPEYFFTYFDNNSYKLGTQNLIDIHKIARRMMDDPSICMEVAGYCDNTGSEALNDRLSHNRAKAVADELIKEYGIDANRIFFVGRGIITGSRGKASYGPNRRVEMRLVSPEELQEIRAKERRNASSSNSNVSSSRKSTYDDSEENYTPMKAAVAEDVNAPAPKKAAVGDSFEGNMLEVITTTKNTTLVKLAQKYYGNGYCWPFIYKANRKKLSNPDVVPPGIELCIPVLTYSQKHITKGECYKIAMQFH